MKQKYGSISNFLLEISIERLNLKPNISIVYNATIKYVSLKEMLTNMHIVLCSARDFA